MKVLPSRVWEAFDTAFREGCGISLEQIHHTKPYQDAMRQQRFNAVTARLLSQRENASSDQGVALRVGVRCMGHLLNTHPEREAVEEARKEKKVFRRTARDAETIALLEVLGQNIVASAVDTLPLEARRLAEHWKRASAERRKGIAKNLVKVLRRKDFEGVDSVESDRANQPRSRVLPKTYGKSELELYPNCLGKTQQVAAFAKLIGAETFLVVPTQTAEERITRVTFRIVHELLNWSEREKASVSKSVFRQLCKISSSWLHQVKRMNFPHYGLAVKFAPGRWILIDPNHNLAAEVSTRYRIEEAAQLLRKYQTVLPGLSVLSWQNEPSLSDLRRGMVREAEELLRIIRESKEGDLDAALVALYDKPAFRNLMDAYGQVPSGEHEDLYWFYLALKFVRHVGALSASAAELKSSKEDLEDELRAGFALRGIQQLPAMAYLRALVECDDALDRFYRRTHGSVEIARTEFGIAAAVLSHVGIDLGFEESVEPALYRVVFGQYRLLNVANSSRRRSGSRSALSGEARRILNKLPKSATLIVGQTSPYARMAAQFLDGKEVLEHGEEAGREEETGREEEGGGESPSVGSSSAGRGELLAAS